jgi:hypothetical protein
MSGETKQQTAGVRSEPRPINERNSMEKLRGIICVIILALMAASLIWNMWPAVIGLLALIGAAQVYWVWRNWQGRRR